MPGGPGRLVVSRRRPWAIAALLAVGALTGCGEERREITDVRERSASQAPPRPRSIEERYGLGAHDAASAHGGGPARVAFTWKVPPGWTELPKAPMREAGFRVAGNPDAECTLSTARGSLLDNLNRWRRQMGLEPTDEAGLAALPKTPFLGGEAVSIELVGRYGGMSGERSLADAKMLGLVAPSGATSVFLKMVGPAAVVDAEAARFREFAASVQPAASPAALAGAGPRDLPPDAPLRWKTPQGWVQGPPRAMRVATFTPEGTQRTEVYAALYGGRAGGTVLNANRWRGQMGLPEATPAEIDALPRVPALGLPAVLVELEGKLDDDMRGVKEDEAMLLGLIAEREEGTVFVKMTGPASEVRAERERFLEFCRSLEDAR